jgi:hypothetical protein
VGSKILDLLPVALEQSTADPGSKRNQKSEMNSKIREAVSKKKKRFVQDGFNLDLTYVTPRVIAMGFPSTGVEAVCHKSIT